MRAGVFAILAACLAAQSAGLWLDVPFVRQGKDGCGSAVLAMTMQYWFHHGASGSAAEADAVQIQNRLYSPAEHGILASALAGYLESHGFRAVAFRGAWRDLSEQLAKGRPLIVCLRSGGDSRHYVVVAGVNGETVEVNDPADRKLRKMERAAFEKKWRAAGNWTLLAVPRALS